MVLSPAMQEQADTIDRSANAGVEGVGREVSNIDHDRDGATAIAG